MKKLYVVYLFAAMSCCVASALPLLQIDISPGQYVSGSSEGHNGETVLATGSEFTLYALIDMKAGSKYDLLSGQYYISAALMPHLDAPEPLGSFSFDGDVVNVTDDMTWGTPANLPSHGVFPTFYKEFAFSADPADRSQSYNTQDVAGNHSGPVADSAGMSYYVPFAIDVSGLSGDYVIHFDFYACLKELSSPKKVRMNSVMQGNLQIASGPTVFKFAPFSHDGESEYQVPDGGATVALLGLSFLALAAIRRQIR